VGGCDSTARYNADVSFEPDILVVDRASSRTLIVIQAKLDMADRAAAEGQLKRYMTAARSPLGILATPGRVWIYSDRERTAEPDSVAFVGEYDLADVADRPVSEQSSDRALAAARFETALQDWIERLNSEAYRKRLPKDLRDVVDEYIVPALLTGEVRAAGPRWYDNPRSSQAT
jgi:hypothetical protein